MKDFAMEAILALGSGIVLAMLGIGVPGPKETEKVIEVFSKEVSDVIDKTFGSIVGQGPLVDNFAQQWNKLSLQVNGDEALSKDQKDVLALIVERVTRDAVKTEGQSLEEALKDTDPRGAQLLVRAMGDLSAQLNTTTDKLTALAKFEDRVQRGRAMRPEATFQRIDSVTDGNIKKDAVKALKEATNQFDFGSPATPGAKARDYTIPRSPLTAPPRDGQQNLVQRGTDILTAARGTADIPNPPENILNVYFAIYMEGAKTNNAPRIAVRKRQDESDPKSAWVNAYDDGQFVITHQAINAYTKGEKDVQDENRRIWRYVIPETIHVAFEIAFFLDVGLGVETALTKEEWAPFYGVTYKDGDDPIDNDTLFYETFLSAQMRELHSGRQY